MHFPRALGITALSPAYILRERVELRSTPATAWSAWASAASVIAKNCRRNRSFFC